MKPGKRSRQGSLSGTMEKNRHGELVTTVSLEAVKDLAFGERLSVALGEEAREGIFTCELAPRSIGLMLGRDWRKRVASEATVAVFIGAVGMVRTNRAVRLEAFPGTELPTSGDVELAVVEPPWLRLASVGAAKPSKGSVSAGIVAAAPDVVLIDVDVKALKKAGLSHEVMQVELGGVAYSALTRPDRPTSAPTGDSAAKLQVRIDALLEERLALPHGDPRKAELLMEISTLTQALETMGRSDPGRTLQARWAPRWTDAERKILSLAPLPDGRFERQPEPGEVVTLRPG